MGKDPLPNPLPKGEGIRSPSPREGLGEGSMGKDPLPNPLPKGEGIGARLSYRERLLAGGLTAAEVGKVEKLFREQLTEQTVRWTSRLAFVRAE